MKTFVIGDIHNNIKALHQVIERSGIDKDKDLLITLGDIVDGEFPYAFQCVEELLTFKNRIDIVGNHDVFFREFLRTGINPDKWSQGGLTTAESYAVNAGIDFKFHSTIAPNNREEYILNLNPSDVPDDHRRFFLRQDRYYKDDDNNIFVHAGFNRKNKIGMTPEYVMTWDRNFWKHALSFKQPTGKLRFEEEVNRVFIGHTSTENWDTVEPMYSGGVWNLDTGSGYEGKLTMMNVATEEYFQSDLVEELYPKHKSF